MQQQQQQQLASTMLTAVAKFKGDVLFNLKHQADQGARPGVV
jgi:hypothetical protein